jgi:hypothetical protein
VENKEIKKATKTTEKSKENNGERGSIKSWHNHDEFAPQ